MIKPQPIPVTLKRYPAKASVYFDALRNAGAQVSCLFGGVVRDTDCDHFYYGQPFQPIKDYDMRVWLPETDFQEKVISILKGLVSQGATYQKNIRPSPHPCYGVMLLENELDLSFRPKPDLLFSEALHLNKNLSIDVAKDRAYDSPIGLSSVTLDNTLQAWAMPEYLTDRANMTLTVLSYQNDIEECADYAERLQARKYPLHKIIRPQ